MFHGCTLHFNECQTASELEMAVARTIMAASRNAVCAIQNHEVKADEELRGRANLQPSRHRA